MVAYLADTIRLQVSLSIRTTWATCQMIPTSDSLLATLCLRGCIQNTGSPKLPRYIPLYSYC